MTRLQRILFTPIFPLWLDAFVLTWVAKFAALAIFPYLDRSDAWELWRGMLEYWWWLAFFLPPYLFVYLSARLRPRRQKRALFKGSIFAFLWAFGIHICIPKFAG